MTSPDRHPHHPVYAPHGMVATSQPLAAAAGLRVLQDGGTAADAAVAMAACLPVVEPTGTGLGSDAFALVWHDGRLHGLNGSGRAPASATATALRDRGLTAVPAHGWDPVTVPGAVAAWTDLHARFGRLPLSRVIEPAASYADEGFPVSPVIATTWRREVGRWTPSDATAAFGPLFAPHGRAPAAGERWRAPDLAASLRAIGGTGGRAFYTGELAERIVAFARATGGALAASDFADHRSEWVEPLSVSYRDHEVWELPPNGQGVAVLEALAILGGFDPADVAGFAPDGRPVAAAWHRQIEATKLALADAHAFVADPRTASVPTAELFADAHAARRRARIGDRALAPAPLDPRASDTVYACAADPDGMMVSYIQSNSTGFGSHVVVPGTGIALHSRGTGFSLTPGHPNELAPGKRPFHTVIPGFVTRGGRPLGPFGVMGGPMQAQGHVQVVVNTVDLGDDPQAALGRPRWCWDAGRAVAVESAAGSDLAAELASRGHDLTDPAASFFGRGQAIWRLDSGVYVGGSEPRADGMALGW